MLGLSDYVETFSVAKIGELPTFEALLNRLALRLLSQFEYLHSSSSHAYSIDYGAFELGTDWDAHCGDLVVLEVGYSLCAHRCL